MEEEFVELLKCPQSKMIFNTPVLSGGNVYEDQLCEDPNKIVYVGLKSFISAFLDSYPNYKNLQYVPLPTKISSAVGKNSLNSGINSKNYDILYKYHNFSISHITNESLTQLLKEASIEHIMYFLDNLTDINEAHEICGWKIINYVFRFSPDNIDVLKYIIEKGGTMASMCPDDNWYPLRQLFENSKTDECIIFGINQHINENLSLYLPDGDGNSLIGLIFRNTNVNIIKYILSIVDKQQSDFADNINLFLDYIYRNQKLTENDKECLVDAFFG